MILKELQHLAATRHLKSGETVSVRGLGAFEVMDDTDPALITVPRCVLVGW